MVRIYSRIMGAFLYRKEILGFLPSHGNGRENWRINLFCHCSRILANFHGIDKSGDDTLWGGSALMFGGAGAEGLEEAVYDSYAMKNFLGIDSRTSRFPMLPCCSRPVIRKCIRPRRAPMAFRDEDPFRSGRQHRLCPYHNGHSGQHA